jgi:hypothetical protein
VVEPSPFPHGQMRNDAEELFALAFWEMTIVVEVMLTTVVEVGMPAQIIQRPSSHAPHYDAIEILMIAVGVLLVVSIAFVF